ncbi:MAG: sel1 repeat family protein [Campylobacteraceae bacterium]|jgi:TPR repeat protein|nr:sel1 repeat family protein [Campylobacteraceae bacterium]
MKKVLVLLATVLLFIGCEDTDFEQGKKAYEKKDYITAKPLFEKSCDSGNAEACENLGKLYYWGKTTGKEYDTSKSFSERAEESKPFFEKACDKKNGKACDYLGTIYSKNYQGSGGDYFKGNEYEEKSCKYGHALGCVSLGHSYYLGLGVRQNLATAVEFYGKGCDLGAQEGCKYYKETSAKLFFRETIENK